jgi:hypothetical protein
MKKSHAYISYQLVSSSSAPAAGASYHGRRAEMITRIVAASNVRPGHVVTMPSAGPHLTLRLMTDVELLLAATIASVRMNRPTSVCEPPASLAACARCQQASRRPGRHRGRGRIAKWMEWVARP